MLPFLIILAIVLGVLFALVERRKTPRLQDPRSHRVA
jgi:hypothetical protein